MNLVTGGAGFIGSHLVRMLVDHGERVRVLDRPGATVEHLPTGRIEIVFADIRDRAAVEKAVVDCERVYHLAANPQLWTHRKGHFRQVNYLGTVNVLEAALAAGARRVLHCSTESILTRARQTTAIAEDQQVRQSEVIGAYCRSKWQAEQFAFRLACAGAPVVIVNPTLPIGPCDRGRSPPTQMILDAAMGKRTAYLDAELNLIDARDVAAGMIAAMERGQPGRRYLLGHENWTIRELFEWVSKLAGTTGPRWAVPYPIALGAAMASEWVADVFTHLIPAASVTGVRLTRRTMRFDPRRSLQELGMSPRPVRESLAEMLVWFREMRWLAATR
ncbi:MAG: NAD-dependent epimerase/dehydratase family protein [Gemmataceae bacterium]